MIFRPCSRGNARAAARAAALRGWRRGAVAVPPNWVRPGSAPTPCRLVSPSRSPGPVSPRRRAPAATEPCRGSQWTSDSSQGRRAGMRGRHAPMEPEIPEERPAACSTICSVRDATRGDDCMQLCPRWTSGVGSSAAQTRTRLNQSGSVLESASLSALRR